MHHTSSNKEAEVEGVIFYSEGAGQNEKNYTDEKKGILSSMKERKKLREGIIRINVNDLVEKTDLSLSR